MTDLWDGSLSTTSFGTALHSVRAFYYKNILHLVPRPNQTRAVLRRGIWVHAGLEHWRKKGDFLPALDALCAWGVEHDLDPQEIEQRRAEAERILMGYVNFYWGEPKWETYATEEKLETEIGGVRLTCTLDWRGHIPQYGHMIGEYKTAGEIPSSAWRSVDPQTALQTVITSRQSQIEPIDGIMFDYLLTKEPSVPGVKKDGEFYANAFDRTTTTAAFEKAVEKLLSIRAEQGRVGESCHAEVEQARSRMVNDGKFYQRFVVLKPDAVIKQTMADVASTVGKIKMAERTGNWPCECDQWTKMRMCAYGKLCTVEYSSGRPAEGLREAEYMVDDGVREGDQAMEKYLVEGDDDDD